MQRYIKTLFSVFLTVGISYGIIYAWSGLTASDGDTLTHTKWNELYSIVGSNETKLDGIETGATSDQTGSEIKALYEAEANTNAFTDVEKTKLASIESGATASGAQTGSEIKALYEAEANTNAFTDTEKTKLSGIESGATGDQTKTDIDGLSINAGQVDGLEGSQFLRSDISDTASGAVTFNGTTDFNASIYFDANGQDINIDSDGLRTGILFSRDSTNKVLLQHLADPDTLKFHFLAGSSGKLTTNGRVGIGTTVPKQALDVSGSITTTDKGNITVGNAKQIGATNGTDGEIAGNKALYLFNNGSTLKLDAYDYGLVTPLNFNLGGNGGHVRVDGGGKGAFRVSQLTTTQRDAMTPENGMIIYNTTTNQFNFYENGAWVTK